MKNSREHSRDEICEISSHIHLIRQILQFCWVITYKQNRIEQIQFDDDIYNTIRRNIKKYRKEKGLTSAQLAEMVDLSHDFIRQIESEKVGYNFSVETFYKISVALGVELDKLIQRQ